MLSSMAVIHDSEHWIPRVLWSILDIPDKYLVTMATILKCANEYSIIMTVAAIKCILAYFHRCFDIICPRIIKLPSGVISILKIFLSRQLQRVNDLCFGVTPGTQNSSA